MARNALSRTPPLGFFKDFVMKDGKHRDSINTKRRGTAPVADLIRVRARGRLDATQLVCRLEDMEAYCPKVGDRIYVTPGVNLNGAYSTQAVLTEATRR